MASTMAYAGSVALHFVSTRANAADSDKTSGPPTRRGFSHFASLSLCSSMVVALATQLKDLLQSIEDFDREIARLYQSHADHALFEALPGAGAALAPRLPVAFGPDRDRYQSAEEIITYVGIAPVLERSGQQHWVHWRHRCPTFLRQTFVEWVNLSRHYSFWAQAFYQQQRDKGKTYQMALRALAFKWIRILYRCWKDRKPYDESRYLMALQRRNSSLLKGIANAA